MKKHLLPVLLTVLAGGAACAASSGGAQPPPVDAHEKPGHVHEPTAVVDSGTTAVPTTSTENPPPGSADAGTTPATSTVLQSDELAVERGAYERAKPVIEKHCARCHAGGTGNRAALTHLDVGRYPFGGHHADDVGATVRRAVGGAGKKATMPKDEPGKVQGEELAAILAWSDSFDRAKAAGRHPKPHGHDHKH